MARTITIYSPKEIAKSLKTRVVSTAKAAEFTVLAGVKRAAYAVSDKAEALNEKIDNHANDHIWTK